MRVMMLIKADPDPGAKPSEELLATMGRYNDELNKAGVLVDLAGLLPSAMRRRVRFSGGIRTVIEAPFPEPRQLSPMLDIIIPLPAALLSMPTFAEEFESSKSVWGSCCLE